jgi:hypothetical protein
MRYKVSGSNRETGARMTLEFEADSKGAAERKASQSGMNVQRVEDLGEGPVVGAAPTSKRRGSGGAGGLKWVILIVLIAGAVYLIGFDHLLRMLHLRSAARP